MSRLDILLAGIGVGLLAAAFVIKLFDLSWLVVSLGVLLLILGGTGLASRGRGRDAEPARGRRVPEADADREHAG